MSSRSPHDIDARIGRHVNVVRRTRGLSQQDLASAVGISFQQLQKYERGTNRVSASRLAHIAEVLRVPIESFFAEKRAEPLPELPGLHEFVGDPRAAQLLASWAKLSSSGRTHLCRLLQAVTGSEDPAQGPNQTDATESGEAKAAG